jgi:hypothetical protein
MAEEERPIDITRQFVEMYAREEMLCFFDFSMVSAAGDAISGLCRISKPKQGRSSMRYLSMVFIVDTPDEASRREVPAMLARLEGDSLKAFVPEIADVMAVPVPAGNREKYVHQVDLLLDSDIEPDERFISAMLLPAVRTLTGVRTSEMVWWGDAAPVGTEAPGESGRETFLGGLRRLFEGAAKKR